jgi:NitT/TauT family transport system substrate-binding protein
VRSANLTRLFRALALAATLAAAGVVTAGAEQLKLAIGYIPHVQFAPLYVGIEKGFYRAEGIDLSIEYGFGIDVFSLLSVGRIDIGLSDSDQLILAGAKGLGLKAVYQYYQRYPVSIVALRGKVAVPEALRGKVVGTPELYGTSYIGLLLFLQHHGLKGAVTVEKIGYTQMTSLDRGKVDAVVCFSNNEPLQFRDAGLDVAEWKVADFSDMVGASFISSDRTIAAKADLLRRFARATRKAMEYTVGNRREAFDLSRSYIGDIDPAKEKVMRAVLDATCELFTATAGYGALDPEVYGHSIAALRELGLIDAAYPASRILASLPD